MIARMVSNLCVVPICLPDSKHQFAGISLSVWARESRTRSCFPQRPSLFDPRQGRGNARYPLTSTWDSKSSCASQGV